jgi:hypothetical protein
VATRTKKVRFDVDYTGGTYTESNGKKLVYTDILVRLMELVMYKKQIDLIQKFMRTYLTIQDKHLTFYFRTMTDVNYKPNLTFPIIPSQYQPEIIGAIFNSYCKYAIKLSRFLLWSI